MTEPNLPDNAEILLYGTEDGTVKIDVLYRDESFWLTQKRMAELFGVQRPAITKHLKNIFETGELEEDSVCSILEHTAADSSQPRMGLETWKNAPRGKILKTDVSVAKNYLNEKELDELNHIVVMYLDYAELQAKKQRLMKMSDWVEKLDAFLRFNDYEILDNPGKVSARVAKELAEKEYASFRVEQDKAFESDFDRLVEKSGEMAQKGKKP